MWRDNISNTFFTCGKVAMDNSYKTLALISPLHLFNFVLWWDMRFTFQASVWYRMADGHLPSLLLTSPETVLEPTRRPSRTSYEVPSTGAKMQNWPFIWGILYEEVRLQKGVPGVLWRCLCGLTSWSWYIGTFLSLFALCNYSKAQCFQSLCHSLNSRSASHRRYFSHSVYYSISI